jgi:hypothetical protein
MPSPRSLLALTLLTACAGSDDSGTGTASNEITFHAESEALPGFAYDTGLQPANSPVQLGLAFEAHGSLVADAAGVAGGEGEDLAVAGTPGSGRYALDAHVGLVGTLKVDVSGFTYEGPIPGIENIDIGFGGEAEFDPFLIGSDVGVTADLPETALPPIPLPGGLPGTLNLTIATGSTITTKLAGDCAGIEDGAVSFKAHTATSGHIVLASKIVLTLPIIGDKEYPIPSIDIDIPAITLAMDLGTHALLGGGSAPDGDSMALVGGCSAGGPDGDDDDDDDGPGPGTGGDDPIGGDDDDEPMGGTCTASDSVAPFAWHPPAAMHADKCTDSALYDFETACASDGATKATCDAFKAQNAACAQCLITDASASRHGAIVRYANFAAVNSAGCIALTAPSEIECGYAEQEFMACLSEACGTCSSGDAGLDACQQEAAGGVCAGAIDAANACYDRIGVSGETARCYNEINYVAKLFCGAD